MIQEAAECSGHLVQEQWVHEDWESGGPSLFFGHLSSSTTRYTDTDMVKYLCMIWVPQDGRNAEKDGGSSFVVSPQQQLYRLHVRSF